MVRGERARTVQWRSRPLSPHPSPATMRIPHVIARSTQRAVARSREPGLRSRAARAWVDEVEVVSLDRRGPRDWLRSPAGSHAIPKRFTGERIHPAACAMAHEKRPSLRRGGASWVVEPPRLIGGWQGLRRCRCALRPVHPRNDGSVVRPELPAQAPSQTAILAPWQREGAARRGRGAVHLRGGAAAGLGRVFWVELHRARGRLRHSRAPPSNREAAAFRRCPGAGGAQ